MAGRSCASVYVRAFFLSLQTGVFVRNTHFQTAPANTIVLGTDPSFFCLKNLTVKGTLVGNMKDTARALDFAKRGLLKPIYTVFPIDRLPEAVEKLRRGEIAGRAVVDFNA